MEAEPLLAEQEIVETFKTKAPKKYLATWRKKIDQEMDKTIIILVILSSISILLSVFILEISWYSGEYENDSFWIESLKFFVLLLTLATVLTLWKKYHLLGQNVAVGEFMWKRKKVAQEKQEGEHQDLDNILWFQYQNPFPFVIEVFFSSLHCPILVHPKLASLTLCRSYHFLTLLRFIPFIRRVRTRQIESEHETSQCNWSTIKIWLQLYPWLSVIQFCIALLPILSYSVFAVERYDDESEIDSYWTALEVTAWTLFVGQAYDPSYAGRFPALLSGISSVMIATLGFVALQRTLEIDAQTDAITADKLEKQMEIQVKKNSAKYTFELMKSYKRGESFNGKPEEPKLMELKQKWLDSRNNLKKLQLRRPAGLASIVIQIQELVQNTITKIDYFRISVFKKLHEMEKNLKEVNVVDDQQKTQEAERILQTYINLQQHSEDKIKKIAEKIDSFRQKNQHNIQKSQSKNSTTKKEIDNFQKDSLKMEKQLKEIINKQALQTENLNHTKMAMKSSKELQKKQLDICEDLRKELKQLAEKQQALLSSNLQTYSEKVFEKINSELQSKNSNSGFILDISSRPSNNNLKKRTSTPASRAMTTKTQTTLTQTKYSGDA